MPMYLWSTLSIGVLRSCIDCTKQLVVITYLGNLKPNIETYIVFCPKIIINLLSRNVQSGLQTLLLL
jgi:hypothetical protein